MRFSVLSFLIMFHVHQLLIFLFSSQVGENIQVDKGEIKKEVVSTIIVVNNKDGAFFNCPENLTSNSWEIFWVHNNKTPTKNNIFWGGIRA